MQMKLTGIEKSFGEKEVLKGASYTFEKGKIYGLIGRNGAGKTTLFNCLSGDVTMDIGEVTVSEGENTRVLAETDIGYVLSTPVLPDFLTGYEFIKFMVEINGTGKNDSGTIDHYFDIVKLAEEDRHRLIKGYSHGMKNKLQMLSFIISQPPIILLDEPLTSFDVVIALEMKKLLMKMKEEHILIFSTHILQLAVDLCDEIVILNNGVLTSVEPEKIHSKDFEEEIFHILRDEGDVE